MGFLDRLFGTSKLEHMPLKWDMHNHILFGIDDGSKSIENSLEMAKNFIDLGFERIIATPHITPKTPKPQLKSVFKWNKFQIAD